MTLPSALKTVGLELELEYLLDRLVRSYLDNNFRGWSTTHDASIETPITFLDGLPIVSSEVPLQGRSSKLGTEILSPVLTPEEMMDDLVKIIEFISENGEIPQSERSAIHIHVSFENLVSTESLKSLMRLAGIFESVFFYLGGMGYRFRGETNDSIYCRPITEPWGPPCVPREGNKWSQVFTLRDILKATNQDSFWELYGDTATHNGKYRQPSRYSWFNLLPLYPRSQSYRAALEFRSFNKSLNPDYIYACIRMCVEFTALAVRLRTSDYKSMGLLNTQNSIFSTTKEETLALLDYFGTLADISDVMPTLKQIINRTPTINLTKGYVFTHKSGLDSFWPNSEYDPPVIPTSQIRKAKYVDIHLLEGGRA